jgi:hypothetical protein
VFTTNTREAICSLKLSKTTDYTKDDFIISVTNTVNTVVLKSDFTRTYLVAVTNDDDTAAKAKATQTVDI